MQICAKFAQLIFSPKSTLICAAFAQLAMCIKVQFMTQPFACRQEKSTVTQKTLNPYFFVPSSRETELLLSSEDNQRERNWLGGGKTSNLVLISPHPQTPVMSHPPLSCFMGNIRFLYIFYHRHHILLNALNTSDT